MTAKDELAALKREVEELKAKISPPKSTFVPMSDAEWADKMHRIREGRMAMATPPSVHQYFADGVTSDCADLRQQAHRPAGRPGMIPDQQPASPRPSAGDGTGWGHSTPLGPPPGVAQADRLMDEADRRDRIELAERLAKQEAMQKLAEGKP